MAISLENLIDLSLLTYYDEKIKAYMAGRITKESKEVEFTQESKLPTRGEVGILYITEDSIKVWDGTKYIKVSGEKTPTGNLGSWGSF